MYSYRLRARVRDHNDTNRLGPLATSSLAASTIFWLSLKRSSSALNRFDDLMADQLALLKQLNIAVLEVEPVLRLSRKGEPLDQSVVLWSCAKVRLFFILQHPVRFVRGHAQVQDGDQGQPLSCRGLHHGV